MLPEDLHARYPELLHVTFAKSWQGILGNGLWSAQELALRLQLTQSLRESLLSGRRSSVTGFDDEALGRITFRDHKAIPKGGLDDALLDMTEAQWYGELSRRVFFYPRAKAAKGLIAAYPDQRQVTITVNTKQLLTSCAERVAVSMINTGYGMRKPVPRGSGTFVPLSEFPRDRLRSIVEITVEDGIEDISDMVVAITDLVDGTYATLWPNGV